MKQDLLIQSYEDKTSTKGNMYTKFITNDGAMSCFDIPLSAQLKAGIGSAFSCEVFTDPAKGYKQIKGVYGPAVAPVTQQKPFVKSTRDTTMYVSYAKDVFLELRKVTDAAIGNSVVMDEAIEIVKKMREAFE